MDETQFRELPGMIALYRAGYAQVSGDLADTVTYARKALELMPVDAPLRGGAMALLGLALWASGDLEAAYQTYAEGIALVHRGGYVNDSSTITFADIRVAQGRLREALRACQRALALADEQGATAPRGVADLHVGISEIYREQGDLAAAVEHLSKSRELGELAGLPENRYRCFIAMAGVKQAQTDFDGALEQLRDAERLYTAGFSPNVMPIPAMRARIWIRQGRLAEASAWTQERSLSPEDEITYLSEYEYVTLARLFLALANTDAAVGLLTRLLTAAETGGRIGTAIEVLVLLAIAHEARGERALAQRTLERALVLAEPEGFVRTFVDEGPPMARLLEEVSKRADGAYARTLLSYFGQGAQHVGTGTDRPQGPATSKHSGGSDLLSERELEVIRLLGSDLSGPEIAQELVVSLNTMRTHTKSIYAKLGVNSRRAAVHRAEELHLL